jgi:hypothetical protein
MQIPQLYYINSQAGVNWTQSSAQRTQQIITYDTNKYCLTQECMNETALNCKMYEDSVWMVTPPSMFLQPSWLLR